MIEEVRVAIAKAGQVAEVAADPGELRRGAGEEERLPVVGVVDEDAPERVREDVREQQPAAVDDSAPRLADAAGRTSASA